MYLITPTLNSAAVEIMARIKNTYILYEIVGMVSHSYHKLS